MTSKESVTRVTRPRKTMRKWMLLQNAKSTGFSGGERTTDTNCGVRNAGQACTSHTLDLRARQAAVCPALGNDGAPGDRQSASQKTAS